MSYKIDWIGTVALGVQTPEGHPLAFSLEEDQSVPPEFSEGDEVQITNHPDHPANIAMGLSDGYYEITHLKTGAVLRTLHRADMYKIES
jgi:hypothetical protein